MKDSMGMFFAGVILITSAATAAHAEAPIKAELYKNPQCGCCDEYAKILEQNGFEVSIKNTEDLMDVKKQAGVPETLAACHTMFVDGYVVEGLVPVDMVERLLKERPNIRGISLPGMPMGAPGMGGAKMEPFKVFTIAYQDAEIYAVE